jgi:hypothetical protein
MEFNSMNQHGVRNLGESQFYGLTANLAELDTKVNLNAVKNTVLKALLVLVDQLPMKQRKRTKASTTDVVDAMADPLVKFVLVSELRKYCLNFSYDFFFHYLQPESDIQQFVMNNKQTQPYILTTNSLYGEEEPGGQYYVVVDQYFITTTGLLRAIETLYKVYWVFNLQYTKELTVFFSFFDTFIFKSQKAVPKAACCGLYEKIKVL